MSNCQTTNHLLRDIKVPKGLKKKWKCITRKVVFNDAGWEAFFNGYSADGIEVTIVDSTGTAIFDNQNPILDLPNFGTFLEFQLAAQYYNGVSIRKVGEDYFIFWVKYYNKCGLQRGVRLAQKLCKFKCCSSSSSSSSSCKSCSSSSSSSCSSSSSSSCKKCSSSSSSSSSCKKCSSSSSCKKCSSSSSSSSCSC